MAKTSTRVSPERRLIRTRLAQAQAAVAEAEGQLDVARAYVTAVRRVCKHPVRYTKRYYDGSTDSICEDCGYVA